MNEFIESLKYTFLYNLIFPIWQILQMPIWYLTNKQQPTPHLIKQKDVKNYATKYKLQTLIETGTYLGAMVFATKNIFKKIYTVELDKKLYQKAKNKFQKYQHINVLFGDSTNVLPKILKQVNEPCLFWLDAHFSNGITAKGVKDTPIMDELNSILNHKVKTHLILIDDANVFTGKKDYPTLSNLKKFIFKKNPSLDFFVKHNIIIITPKKQLSQQEHI